MKVSIAVASIIAAIFLSGCALAARVAGQAAISALPVMFVIDPSGDVSIHGEVSLVTKIGKFPIGVTLPITANSRDESITLILRDRRRNPNEIDDVYVIKSQDDEFAAVLDGQTSIRVSNRRIELDVTEAKIKVIEFKRPGAAVSITTKPGPTGNPAPPTAAPPTATPSEGETWIATQRSLDGTWERDWPQTITSLEQFLSRFPDHQPARDKLYAALVAYGDQLAREGKLSEADRQYTRALPLVSQPGEARVGLTALTPTAVPAGTVILKGDWSGGLSGWAGGPSWRASNGQLFSEGGNTPIDGETILSPGTLGSSRDYALELDLQVVRLRDEGSMCIFCSNSFGIVVRGEGQKGYVSGFEYTAGASEAFIRDLGNLRASPFEKRPGRPGKEWRKYRIEVRANTIRFIMDGGVLLTATDNRYSSAGRVGLWNNGVQFTVRNLTVKSL